MNIQAYLKMVQQRRQRLGVSASELDIADELELLEMQAALADAGAWNEADAASALHADALDVHLDGVVAAIEYQLRSAESLQNERPFVDPPFLCRSETRAGSMHLADTWNGIPLYVLCGGGGENSFVHMHVCGATASGKSTLLAKLAQGAQSGVRSHLIIDSTKSFRRLALTGFEYVRWEDLRLNPFDAIGMCRPIVSAQMAAHELALNYKLIYGEYELVDACSTLLQQQRAVSWPAVLQSLKAMTSPRFSRRAMYVESCVLVVSTMLAAFDNVFHASRGMNLLELCNHNIVLEVDGLLPQHRSYLIRTLFACLHAGAVLGGRRLQKPLVLMIDETQELASQQGFAAKLLDVRHAGIHVVFALQNPSTAAIELAGNVSGVVGFQLVDGRDQQAFGNAAGLNAEQRAFMAKLRPGECVCRFPGMAYKSAFLARVPDVQRIANERDVNAMSRQFLSRFAWTPYVDAREAARARVASWQTSDARQAARSKNVHDDAAGLWNASKHCDGTEQTNAGVETRQERDAGANSGADDGRIKTERATASADADNALSSDELRLMVEASTHWHWGVTRLYERVGLDRVRGRKVVERLHALGMVLPHAVASGTRGGGLRLLELTERGWAALETRGFTRMKGVTRGGFVHSAVAMALQEKGRAGGHEVRFEYDVNGVFGDVVWVSPTGRLTVWQIGLSSASWESASVKRLLAAAGVDEVVLAVKDREFLNNAAARLHGVLTNGESRVRLCCVGEILAESEDGIGRTRGRGAHKGMKMPGEKSGVSDKRGRREVAGKAKQEMKAEMERGISEVKTASGWKAKEETEISDEAVARAESETETETGEEGRQDENGAAGEMAGLPLWAAVAPRGGKRDVSGDEWKS